MITDFVYVEIKENIRFYNDNDVIMKAMKPVSMRIPEFDRNH